MPVNKAKKPVYSKWVTMRHNTSPTSRLPPAAARYYAGISVCREWQDYETFEEWALSHGWQPGMRLVRRDKTGDFCPENCFWATLAEANNWRSVVRRLPDGRTVRDLIGREARGHDRLRHARVRERIFHGGWRMDDAVERPAKKARRRAATMPPGLATTEAARDETAAKTNEVTVTIIRK